MDNKKQKRNDAVDPYSFQIGGSHYSSMKIQPSEFINKNNLPFAEGNVIKYLCRHKQKGQKQDLEKAKHFIDKIWKKQFIIVKWQSIVIILMKVKRIKKINLTRGGY